jgi:hypothetical protein
MMIRSSGVGATAPPDLHDVDELRDVSCSTA